MSIISMGLARGGRGETQPRTQALRLPKRAQGKSLCTRLGKPRHVTKKCLNN